MAAFTSYAQTMTSGNSLVTFDVGRPWDYVYLQVPTMASFSILDMYVAAASGATFYQLRQNSVTGVATTFTIAASLAANGGVVPVPSGFQYMQFRATDSAPTAATTFKILGGGNY